MGIWKTFYAQKLISSLFKPKKQRFYAQVEQKYLSLYLYKGKIGHLYAQENKKRPTHPRTTKRGVQ